MQYRGKKKRWRDESENVWYCPIYSLLVSFLEGEWTSTSHFQFDFDAKFELPRKKTLSSYAFVNIAEIWFLFFRSCVRLCLILSYNIYFIIKNHSRLKKNKNKKGKKPTWNPSPCVNIAQIWFLFATFVTSVWPWLMLICFP